MKFNIQKIILWLKNGQMRQLDFLPNMVNVITGDSNTGKTAILEIIDYCWFSSKSSISDSIINENVLWYGMMVNINDKTYTIARSRITEGRVSNDYYFSSVGEVPSAIKESNINETSLKSILETEFKIDKTVSFPVGYGSNNIKMGSKISLRYFLLFNTISQDIITNGQGIFYDKQNESRYRDALPRIFDIATGIETIENILRKEKKLQLEKKLLGLEQKENQISKKTEFFRKEQNALIKRAKEFLLIDSNAEEDEALEQLKAVVGGVVLSSNTENERENLEKQKNINDRRIRNLKKFISEYSLFKKNASEVGDSLKPIEFLTSNFNSTVKTEFFEKIFSNLSEELAGIKEQIKKKTPVDKQVNDEISLIQSEQELIKKKLETLPSQNRNFENEKAKYFFLGEVKSKLQFYSTPSGSLPQAENQEEIERVEKEIEEILVENTEDRRNLTIKLIEEIIREYMDSTGTALENYKDYLPVFDYKEKRLLLRKPKQTFIENVGSSSNHMFLHLFFSLAIQEVIFKNNSPYVAPILLIDQPSRPYYGDDGKRKADSDHSDDYKITTAFQLLDKFIEERKKNGGEFQMIVFEHIPPSLFKNMGNVRLVDKEFKNGNALIPDSMLT
ncbi:DUF3732 domain-containing protein [Salinimicrobium sp. TIG7-5_MAKvit]|uniref:DUF3732 domain-containing protein n=1 Tax=Salinimicrobium sp. TIG7-5_MAKvit TaxID=3121289 RepID=UPI003C6DFA9A